MGLRHKYNVRTKYCYNLGLLAFLSGLGLILVPHQAWPWPWGKFVGIVVVSVSIVIELAWTLSNGKRPKVLLPTDVAVTPDSLDDDGAGILFNHRGTDEAVAANLLKCTELLEKVLSTKIP
jgi:hypothetical protein